ncbi:ATP-binding protein [Candidatus Methanarcanum hacksteinii]|uniref:ATP-binding protein n=1 Tax=Candidatus Methanarcanum hacksteinii TaxID=2911857 RepID=UPI0037DD7F3F|nr:MAG: ATPase [Candidatus Methanarcanum hacksteinii]
MKFSRENYLKRIMDDEFKTYLEAFGAVCVEGPKGCGKTWFSLNNSKSAFMLADPKNNFMNRRLAEVDINIIFEGERPHLIDEWQDIPEIWDATKSMVDDSDGSGQFILTGSSTPNIKGIRHSGAGRIGVLKLRTMSLYESGDSSGKISLKGMFDDEFDTTMTGEISLKKLIELTVRGGWPQLIDKPIEASALAVRGYVDRMIDDAARLDDITRDRNKLLMAFRSLSRHESTLAHASKITADILDSENDGSTEFNKSLSITDKTMREYVDVFNRLFLIENQFAFSLNPKSGLRVGKMPKRHLTDPSLAIAALGLNVDMLYSDLKLYGLYFEAMCERDLSIYIESIGGKLFHYRDHNNREVDAVAELPDGRYALFEIKLGTREIESAAENLIKIRDIWKSKGIDRMPEFMCIICGMSNAAYRRSDGIFVVPITALGP